MDIKQFCRTDAAAQLWHYLFYDLFIFTCLGLLSQLAVHKSQLETELPLTVRTTTTSQGSPVAFMKQKALVSMR